jgi:hypothetical protein
VILCQAKANAGYGAPAYLARTMPGYSSVTIHGVEISCYTQLKMLVADDNRTDLVVSLMKPDPNRFEEMLDTGAVIVMQVILECIAAVTIGIAIVKLKGFILCFGFRVSPPQLCLTTEIIGSLGATLFD